MEPRINTQASNTAPAMVESRRRSNIDFRSTSIATWSTVERIIVTMNTVSSARVEDIKFAIGNFDDEEEILKPRNHAKFDDSRVRPGGFGAGAVGM